MLSGRSVDRITQLSSQRIPTQVVLWFGLLFFLEVSRNMRVLQALRKSERARLIVHSSSHRKSAKINTFETVRLLSESTWNTWTSRNELAEHGRECEYFTMMRHPIDRLVSAFFYCPTDHDVQTDRPRKVSEQRLIFPSHFKRSSALSWRLHLEM